MDGRDGAVLELGADVSAGFRICATQLVDRVAARQPEFPELTALLIFLAE